MCLHNKTQPGDSKWMGSPVGIRYNKSQINGLRQPMIDGPNPTLQFYKASESRLPRLTDLLVFCSSRIALHSKFPPIGGLDTHQPHAQIECNKLALSFSLSLCTFVRLLLVTTFICWYAAAVSNVFITIIHVYKLLFLLNLSAKRKINLCDRSLMRR